LKIFTLKLRKCLWYLKISFISYLVLIKNNNSGHITNLTNKTHILSGKMRGKTQLPVPPGANKVTDEDLKMAEK